MEHKNLMFNSIKAGMLIGFGCMAYILVPNHVLGAFLFSLGLLTVCILKLTLYTGQIGSYGDVFWFGGNSKWKNAFEEFYGFFFMFAYNTLGIGLLCYLFGTYSGLDFSPAIQMVQAKANETWIGCLVRAIGCGAMMEIAVSGYRKTKSALCIILPVMVFILCGFEHCIADFGYMALSGISVPWVVWTAVAGNSIGSWLISKFNY